jgi:hypothetical protein
MLYSGRILAPLDGVLHALHITATLVASEVGTLD